MKKKSLVMGLVLALGCSLAQAQVKVGVTVSATGPAASLGVPEKNTVDLLPREIAGQKIEYLVLDDASDTTTAVSNTRKFITEHQVDMVMGSTVSPNALAMIDVVAEAKVPMIAFAASEKIVSPVDDKRRWVFKTAQNDRMMAEAIVEHMAANGVKTVGFIGFSDAYGEGWFENFKAALDAAGLSLVVNERYNRTDTSVTGQVLKIVGAKPDAVLIAGSGTPAALPQKTLKERGYAGKIYQTHGVANNDFLRVCGRDCEGTFLPAGPVLVAAQLPDDHPVKPSAMEYVRAYEEKFGKGSVSTFGAHVWDAGKLLAAALPEALTKAKPGTPEFRVALRDALEHLKEVHAAMGVFTMSPTDHLGLDRRARVIVRIEQGAWKYVR
ncbi:ABC transporter substrate-binding protein [Tepidiphilus thermophilus]|uniref:Amino acid/amide ABC transporter substrate-binding protein, HAAT family (TC 3.A.1.4.-) n=1 Tax=Tepidiphilus thermophilus TaxID=876478 RepID=A0A0K6ITI5_9PROT|nr:ABC transporter substrate-binding protein [Tepidiphilus thermophilus]CUB06420.1 amino acid/amide ABC transporter substrate-binding protein, HAAT family (TC 3.A.1.4.-) [Tepidiphilus thermophilus]